MSGLRRFKGDGGKCKSSGAGFSWKLDGALIVKRQPSHTLLKRSKAELFKLLPCLPTIFSALPICQDSLILYA